MKETKIFNRFYGLDYEIVVSGMVAKLFDVSLFLAHLGATQVNIRSCLKLE